MTPQETLTEFRCAMARLLQAELTHARDQAGTLSYSLLGADVDLLGLRATLKRADGMVRKIQEANARVEGIQATTDGLKADFDGTLDSFRPARDMVQAEADSAAEAMDAEMPISGPNPDLPTEF